MVAIWRNDGTEPESPQHSQNHSAADLARRHSGDGAEPGAARRYGRLAPAPTPALPSRSCSRP